MIITGKELLDKDDLVGEITSGLTTKENSSYGGRLHASSNGYCARRGALTSVYEGETVYSASSKMYMGIGSSIENLILDALDARKKLLFRQYALPDIGINLGGRVDGVIIYNGQIHVLEIKSCGKLPTNPNPEHTAQLMIYSAVTGLPAILLYASRNVMDFRKDELLMKEFYFGFDKERTNECLSNAAFAYFAAKNKLLPNIPEYIKSKSDCGFCPFTNICWDYEPPVYLEPMSDSENSDVERAVTKYIEKQLSTDEIRKRRNGVLKYLSEYGNKTAKFYLDHEDWNNLLLEL